MSLEFEWCIEWVPVDSPTEIEDVDFYDSFEDAYKMSNKLIDEGLKGQIVLRCYGDPKRLWDNSERSFAYFKDGKLPLWFTDSFDHKITKVPSRFHNEVKKFLTPTTN